MRNRAWSRGGARRSHDARPCASETLNPLKRTETLCHARHEGLTFGAELRESCSTRFLPADTTPSDYEDDSSLYMLKAK